MSAVSSIVARSAQEIYRDRTLQQFEGEENATLILSHFGEFTHSKIDQLIKFIETSVLLAGSKRKVMKRICSVLIECLQNVTHHASRDADGSQQSFVTLHKTDEAYHISTGNLLSPEDATLVSHRLTELNKLDQNEVRKLYIETLCNENFSFKGGAGLGFLTIAKKTKSPVGFEVIEINESWSYLTLAIRIQDVE